MADFGVYFMITNKTSEVLSFVGVDHLDHASWDESNPKLIPNDGKPYKIHLNDPDTAAGAGGVIHYVGHIKGEYRYYAWYGDCPVWHKYNSANGPGITSWNDTGHPLTVTIFVDDNTKGWTPARLSSAMPKEEQAALVGKTPVK